MLFEFGRKDSKKKAKNILKVHLFYKQLNFVFLNLNAVFLISAMCLYCSIL